MYSLTDPQVLRYLCNKYGFRLKKSLGQNFLNDEEVPRAIADAAEIDGFGALEIGPGLGVLTVALAARAAKVVTVELDRSLAPVLEETLADFSNIEVLFDDVLKLNLPTLLPEKFGAMPVSVAANLPYYITTPIIMALLEARLPLQNIVVMVQKEVADRILALPGKKDYGALTIAVQYYCEASTVCQVPRTSFTPMPQVDSTVLKLAVRSTPLVLPQSEKHFFSVVKASFAQRRKTLVNGLANAGAFGGKTEIATALEALSLSPTTRGETLSIAQFSALSDLLLTRHTHR